MMSRLGSENPRAEAIYRRAFERAPILIFRTSVVVEESKRKVRSDTFQVIVKDAP
jgi:hypothetical protein